jgi:hypothetical protein
MVHASEALTTLRAQRFFIQGLNVPTRVKSQVIQNDDIVVLYHEIGLFIFQMDIWLTAPVCGPVYQFVNNKYTTQKMVCRNSRSVVHLYMEQSVKVCTIPKIDSTEIHMSLRSLAISETISGPMSTYSPSISEQVLR